MKRFLTAVAFCFSMLVLGAFLIVRSSAAKEDMLLTLLSLPAPPPPNPMVQSGPRDRPEHFYDIGKPPKDDAPIEDLLDYWSHQNANSINSGNEYFRESARPKPSRKALDRILAEIEKQPQSIGEFLNVIKGSDRGVEIVKRMYDEWRPDVDSEQVSRAGLKDWLTYNSPYFVNDLAKKAQQIVDVNGYISDDDDFHALTRVDWERAKPIVDGLYLNSGQPASQVLARWALYRHAMETGSIGDIDRYREELQATVSDREATIGMRDLALDALLVEKEWSGRDDWYYSLMADETLLELGTYTGLTTLMIQSPGDRYVDKMIEFSKSENATIRAAAVRNLVVRLSTGNPEVVRALLPWLANPKWAKDDGNSRQMLVRALESVKMPESVPGLIAALDEKETRELEIPDGNLNGVANAANRAATAINRAATAMNRMASNVMSDSYRPTSVTFYSLRGAAISALGMQGDMRAAPALRRILPEVEDYERGTLVKALVLCNGFTLAEQADALEALARIFAKQNEAEKAIEAAANAMNTAAIAMSDAESPRELRYSNTNSASNSMRAVSPLNPADLKQMLGLQLIQIKEVSDLLVRELVQRIDVLDKNDPPVAAALRSMFLNWQSSAINSLLLRDLKNGKSNPDAVVKLLSIRKELREKQPNDVYDIRTGTQTALGISACLIEADADYAAILAGENSEAKIAMLACARLIRARLPVQETAKYLDGKDKMLGMAAERYLESEDSPEARALVLSLHPNEAKILGATTAFQPERAASSPLIGELFSSVDPSFNRQIYYLLFGADQFRDIEKRLQKEVKENADLMGIYSYADNIIRIYKDKAVFSWEEDQSRYRERTLKKEEFDYFKGYLAHHKVDELVPFLACTSQCDARQLLMLGRQGGRRVFVHMSRTPQFFVDLEAMFQDMRRPPAKLHYALEKDIPGLEILFADENLTAETVWKSGSDFRLLVADKIKRKEINREIVEAEESLAEAETGETDQRASEETVWQLQKKREFDDFSWFNFNGSGLAAPVAQPEQVEFLPIRDSFAVQPPSGQWKAKSAGVEIRADSEGLYKIGGGKFTNIGSGSYDSPVATANGRWAIVTKYSDDEGTGLVRVKLATGKEFEVLTENYPITRAVAFVPAIGKVLVTGYNDEEYDHHGYGGKTDDDNRNYFWLDPETGAIQPVSGEVRPLGQQKFRSLQPTAAAFEFWAAIPNLKKNETDVGIYNSKTLTFKSTLKIPRINFNSMDMWIDEQEGKIYFVYNGHLLALPLNPKADKYK